LFRVLVLFPPALLHCVAFVALFGLPAGAAQATLTVSAGQSSCERFGNVLVSCALASAPVSGDHPESLDIYSFAADASLGVVADAGLLLAAATLQPTAFDVGSSTSHESGGDWHYQPDPQDPFIPVLPPGAWLEAGRFRSLVEAHADAPGRNGADGGLIYGLSEELPRPVPLAVMVGLTGLVIVGLLRGLRGV
jgi:hypothetical protein